MSQRSVAVLGATGSVGEATLAVARNHPNRLRVSVLAAQGTRPARLAELAREFRPDRVIVAEAVRGSGIAIDAAIAPGRRHHGNQRPAVAVAAGEQVRARNQGHVVSRDAAICPVAAGR